MVTMAIVLMIGLLGLSVDVGWAYYRREAAQARGGRCRDCRRESRFRQFFFRAGLRYGHDLVWKPGWNRRRLPVHRSDHDQHRF